MRTKRFTVAMAAIVLGWTGGASAQGTAGGAPTGAADEPRLSVGTEIFTGYALMTEPTAADATGEPVTANAFDVTRGYVDVNGRISHTIAFRLTPDIVRETDSSSAAFGSLVYRLKFAYAEMDLGSASATPETWVRIGMQPTPFVGYEEGIYRYRFQGTLFVDRVGALVDSDAGVSLHANLPEDYGDVHVGLYNGEGFASAEANNEKSVQVRGTVRPFAHAAPGLHGLRVTAFYDGDDYLRNAERRRTVIDATFESRRFNAGFDELWQRDQPLPSAALARHDGWSVWVTPFFKAKGQGPETLIRYDSYTLKTAADELRRRVIAGVAYWFPHAVDAMAAAVLLDFDQLTFTNFPAVPADANQRTVALHVLIDY